jgi:hypothetical protein
MDRKYLSSNCVHVILLSSIHRLVKDTMHRAFWDNLEEELNEVPPNYTQAMVLLGEIKEVMYTCNMFMQILFSELHCLFLF